MRIDKIKYNHCPRLLIIFCGWSVSPEILRDIKSDEGEDLWLVSDYRDLLFPEDITPYEEIRLISWSFGVYVASRICPEWPARFGTCIAINGTPRPIDDAEGIPCSIFQSTLQHLSPENVRRDEKGRVDTGDEYLTVLDGMTGQEIAHVDWPKRNDRYGNLVRRNRNQIGMAFLDGKTPCILACRGTYKLMTVEAWQLNGNKLESVWKWDGDEENPVVRSMGAHNMVCGDVDEDGREEILTDSCALGR